MVLIYRRFIMRHLLFLAFLSILAPQQIKAYTITGFDPLDFINTGAGPNATTVANLDNTVGLNGAIIEDFEDDTLINGLSRTFNGASPAVFTAGQGLWDGTKAFVTNSFLVPTVFGYTPGADTFAIGIGDVESALPVEVNGQVIISDIRNLLGYNRVSDNSREVYIRIDREQGDTAITEVRFAAPASDGIVFDHLAVFNSSAVPEPATYTMGLIALIALAFSKRKS